MNNLYNDNSMEALDLYSRRLEADRSRFTGGRIPKGTKLSAQAKAALKNAREVNKILKEVGIPIPRAPRKRVARDPELIPKKRKSVKGATVKRVRKPLTVEQKQKRLISEQKRLMKIYNALEEQYPDYPEARRQVEFSHLTSRKPRKTTKVGLQYFNDLGMSGCLSAINDDRYNFICNRLKPKPPRKRKPKGSGLSGLGYGLSGLDYSSASGLSAAGLSGYDGGACSMKQARHRMKWDLYQQKIAELRSGGVPYRLAQKQAAALLRN
jgi:hypothetical protein